MNAVSGVRCRWWQSRCWSVGRGSNQNVAVYGSYRRWFCVVQLVYAVARYLFCCGKPVLWAISSDIVLGHRSSCKVGCSRRVKGSLKRVCPTGFGYQRFWSRQVFINSFSCSPYLYSASEVLYRSYHAADWLDVLRQLFTKRRESSSVEALGNGGVRYKSFIAKPLLACVSWNVWSVRVLKTQWLYLFSQSLWLQL